jgi:hypothetical protein
MRRGDAGQGREGFDCCLCAFNIKRRNTRAQPVNQTQMDAKVCVLIRP